DATVFDSLDAARADLLALRILYIPFTNPEIELFMLRLIQTRLGQPVAESKQFLEARIIAQARQIWIACQRRDLTKTCIQGFIQPLESLVLIVQLRVGSASVIHCERFCRRLQFLCCL